MILSYWTLSLISKAVFPASTRRTKEEEITYGTNLKAQHDLISDTSIPTNDERSQK